MAIRFDLKPRTDSVSTSLIVNLHPLVDKMMPWRLTLLQILIQCQTDYARSKSDDIHPEYLGRFPNPRSLYTKGSKTEIQAC